MKELFGQSLVNTVAESDRVAVAVPGQIAAKNILFSKFWAQLKAIFGVNNWEAREYKSSPCIVVYDKKQYILDENLAPLPFLSENFADELLANIWVALGSTSDLTNYLKKTGETTIPEMANDDAICKVPLYNYYATIDPRGICPIGWHIPTQAEWDNLAVVNGGASISGGRLKEGGLAHWNSPNSGYPQNTLNFVGSGYRNLNGIFSNAKNVYLSAISGDIDSAVACYNTNETLYASFSCNAATGRRVRCVKDDNIIPTGAVLDADGNNYNFVQLGSNIWLKEDLKTTKYNNGDLIQNIVNDTTWKNLTTGSRCYYPPINKYKTLVYTETGEAKLLEPSATSSETITVDNAAAYDDSAIYGTIGIVVTYSDPLSLIPQFQAPQLYQVAVAMSIAGITPEESPYDPILGTGNWQFIGQSMTVTTNSTAQTYIKGAGGDAINQLRNIKGYQNGHNVILEEYGNVFLFNSLAVVGSYNPNTNTYPEVFKPFDWADAAKGGWVEMCAIQKKQLFYSNAASIKEYARNPTAGDDAIDLSTGNILKFETANAPYTESATVVVPNYLLNEIPGAFVKFSEYGEKGFINWVQNTVISALLTFSKTISGAVNELFKTKQRANPSWDKSTVPTAADIVINEPNKTITFGTINGAPLSVSNPAIYKIDQADGTVKWYQITAPVVFTYTATYGIWWIYFDDLGGKILNGVSIIFGAVAPLLRFVYSTDENRINTRVGEFHPDTLSAVAHKRAHVEGTIWLSGGDLVSNALTSGAPNADGRNTCIALTSVTNMDDNFEYTIANNTSGAAWSQDLGNTSAAALNSTNSAIFNVTYNQSDGHLRVLQGTRFPFPWNAATNKPQTISQIGVFTDVPNNYFFCSFIYFLQDFKTGEAGRLRTSTIAFATIEEARAYSWDTLKGFSPTLTDNEIRQHLKEIWEVKNSYSNLCKYAVLRESQYLRQNPLTTTQAQGGGSITASNVIATATAAYPYVSQEGKNNAYELDLTTESYHVWAVNEKESITRNYNFKVTKISATSGSITLLNSSGGAYTEGATVTANDYVTISSDTFNARLFIKVERV